MGAIAGIFAPDGAKPRADDLARMSQTLAARAPGADERWVGESCALLHRANEVRPSISDSGQPLADSSGRYRIVCSGRIFNSRELVHDLRAQGAIEGASPSILSVLLHAYTAWGMDAFRRCNGAFACAIHDSMTDTLVLVRDQIGVHPLYYRTGGGSIIFASEVKAILAHSDVPRLPDETGIANYLSGNRYLLLDEHTFYHGISRLLPGHALVASSGRVEVRPYWSIEPGRRSDVQRFDEAVERTRELLIDAVRIRIPEGDRVGAASSGGFDSSSVVCIVSRLLRERGARADLHTFSFDFGSEAADEPHLVDAVTRFAGAVHHPLRVLTADFLDETDELVAANDGPTLEDSVLLLWKKKRNARACGVDVLLSGLGGDELFMGRLNYMADLLRSLHWKELYGEVRSIYPVNPNTGLRTSLRKLLRAYAIAPLEPRWIKNARRRSIANPFPPAWMAPALVQRTGVGSRLPDPPRPRFRSVFDQDCYDVFNYELLGGAVPYHDIASSRWAVDTRFPLLDVRLVEHMFAMPREWKIRRGKVRMLQKEAVMPFVPPQIAAEHIKKDFHPVLNAFLRGAYATELVPLLEQRTHASDEYVAWGPVGEYYAAFAAGKIANPFPLWLVSNLERWLRREFA
jgi:asparagine synthase (glutamine-hydrolysing)